jgi:hypothetical protein
MFSKRLLHDPRIWSLKSIPQRNVVINNYYSFIPKIQPTTTVFNVPNQAGKKPGQRRSRTSSAKTRKNESVISIIEISNQIKTDLFHLDCVFSKFS